MAHTSMSIEDWADAARKIEYRQKAEHQRAIDTIQSLLEGKISPDAAAGSISSLYEPLLKAGFKSSSVGTLWGILCDAIRALGGNKGVSKRLVDLLNSISQLPDVTNEYGKAITPEWSSAGVYWRDLPELTVMMRHHVIYIEPEDDMEGMEGTWDDQVVPLLNATTFGAMYLACGRGLLGMPWFAELWIMKGIEVPCQTPKQQRRAAMYVPPAATWVLFASERIYKLCKENYDRKDGASGSTPDNDKWLWGKSRGYSLERWAFWKKRFGEIAETEGLNDGVKDIAARAASQMEKVEG